MQLSSSLRSLLAGGLLLPALAACAPAPAPIQPTAAPAQPTAPVQPTAPSAAATAPPAATAAAKPAVSPVAAPSPTPSLVKRTSQAAAYYTDERGRPQGSLHPFSVSIQPGPREQEFRLGFFETNVGQLGSMWRAAAWMATSVGAFETGKDINALRVSWETTGRIDGPSAGGLMTSAFISGVLGHEMNKDVAFTGTINPDGSIGPVGGILYKLEAAAKEGKKTFLIPIGQRTFRDEETGQTVDLISKGQLSNIKVQEVATLDEAYEVLTGKTLPRTQAPSRAPDLSTDAYDRMRPKVLEWKAEYGDAAGRFASTSASARSLFEYEISDLESLARKGDADLNQGAVASAYGAYQEAVVGMNAVALGARTVEVLLGTGDFAQAEAVIVQSAGAGRVEPLLERLKVLNPSVPEDGLLAVAAWSELVSTIALDSAVRREVQAARNASDSTTRLQNLVSAGIMQSSQRYTAKAAEDILTFNFGKSRTTNWKVDADLLNSWAGIFTRAAEANLTYFDSIVVDQAAQSAGMRTEEAKLVFEARSLPYVVATFGASPGAQDYLERNVGKGPGRSYAQLGFAIASYLASSQLVAEYYSLGAELDEDGNLVGFARDRALSSMLDAASDRSRERIAAADKAGGDPSLSTVYFQAARAARDSGSPDKKMSALDNYWRSSVYARLLALMMQGAR